MSDAFRRAVEAGDAEAMAAVHGEAFDAAWSAHEIGSLLAGPGGFALLAEGAAGLAGFVLCRAIVGEAEVLTIAVAPADRRSGVGRALVEAAIVTARAAGAQALFLEVAQDNAAALGLYAAAGFVASGRRRGYYQRGGASAADAIVLRRELNT